MSKNPFSFRNFKIKPTRCPEKSGTIYPLSGIISQRTDSLATPMEELENSKLGRYIYQFFNTNILLAADYRYNNGYYNGVYDYYNYNPQGYKPGYNYPDSYNPGYYNPGYYNSNRYYNRRSYPSYYEGSPYGQYNSGYYSGYHNNTRYPYGNHPGYRVNYPSPFHNYPGNQVYNPYNPAYNDRYYNQEYYQGGLYNNAGAYSRSDDARLSKNQ